MRSNVPRVYGEAASHDSSSLNRRSMSLNAQGWKEKWVPEEDLRSAPYAAISAKRGMRFYAEDMTREQRRQLRKRLRHELNKVRGLTSRIEARELQLRRQSQSTGIYPSMSDAQFSVNDVRSNGGKEVTSQLQQSFPGNDDIHTEAELSRTNSQFPLASPTYSSHLLRGQSIGGTRTDTELSYNKHTKATQMQASHLSGGKEKTPPAVNSRLKPSSGNKRPAPSTTDWKVQKSTMVGALGKKNIDFFPQCKALHKKIMGHKDAWVFNEPVDAVKLGLSDYHSVIKKPMDLGTIKGKLERKEYSSPQQFASDVRLTFKNAMTYNPPGNDVHGMANELQRLFEENWKILMQKMEIKDGGGRLGGVSQERGPDLSNASPALCRTEGFTSQEVQLAPQPTLPSSKPKTINGGTFLAKPKVPANKPKPLESNTAPVKPKPPTNLPVNKPKPFDNSTALINKPKAPAKPKHQVKSAPLAPKAVTQQKPTSQPKREMNYQEKATLIGRLQLLPAQMQDGIIRLMKERNSTLSQKDDEIEVDIDSFDNDTLWELDEYINNCFASIDERKSAEGPKSQPTSSKTHQQLQGDGQEEDEDVNIMSDVPKPDLPGSTCNVSNNGNRPSSSSSSSSGSGSSSDSDSESSSGSESDAS